MVLVLQHAADAHLLLRVVVVLHEEVILAVALSARWRTLLRLHLCLTAQLHDASIAMHHDVIARAVLRVLSSEVAPVVKLGFVVTGKCDVVRGHDVQRLRVLTNAASLVTVGGSGDCTDASLDIGG